MTKILVANDDGIEAPSLWTLVAELKKIAEVYVIAPDCERSAIGTAVSLFRPLQVKEYKAPIEGVTAYTTDGTPGDCIILGHGKLIDKVDMVVSGINPGPNLGEDVYISGTVGAAMQGYFRGLPAVAVSAAAESKDGLYTGVFLKHVPGSTKAIAGGAKIAAALVQKMAAEDFPRLFLNVNLPNRPLREIENIEITRLALSSHINFVTEETLESGKEYRLIRERIQGSDTEGTDIRAFMEGRISVTPLYTSLFDKPPQRLLKKIVSSLLTEAKKI